MYTPKEHEELFEIKPIGVRYICELCGKGEMIAMSEDPIRLMGEGIMMRKHQCTNCKGIMQLPKTYPYIEWTPVEKEVKENEDSTT